MAKPKWEALRLDTGRTLWRQTRPDGSHLAVWERHETAHDAIVTDPSGKVVYRGRYSDPSVAKSQAARKL